VKLFAVGLDVPQIVERAGVNRNTVRGDVEVDESYFGARLVN
jgi:hypothetical protein